MQELDSSDAGQVKKRLHRNKQCRKLKTRGIQNDHQLCDVNCSVEMRPEIEWHRQHTTGLPEIKVDGRPFCFNLVSRSLEVASVSPNRTQGTKLM